MTDEILTDLAGAHLKLDATREGSKAALDSLDDRDARDVELTPIRNLPSRLDPMAAEVARIEKVVEGRPVAPRVLRA